MFHIAVLKSEDVQQGMLFKINDMLDEAFTTSARAIRERGMHGDKDEMVIYFENMATDPNFYDNHSEDIHEVLYFNDSAKEVIERADIGIVFGQTVETLPQGLGVMARMYRFINLR